MVRTRLVVIAVASVAAAGPAPARAEPGLGDYIREIGEGLVTGLAGEDLEVDPYATLQLAVEGSFAPEVTGELSVGVGWGEVNTGWFGDAHIHRLAIGLRGSRDPDNSAALIAGYGHTVHGFVSYGFDAGLALRVSDDRRVGGFARVAVGYGPVAIYVRGEWYPRAEDAGLGIGLRLEVPGVPGQ